MISTTALAVGIYREGDENKDIPEGEFSLTARNANHLGEERNKIYPNISLVKQGERCLRSSTTKSQKALSDERQKARRRELRQEEPR